MSLLLSTFVPHASAQRPVGRAWATRSEIVAQHGMAATSHPLATQVALDVLRQGGTAADAAIAANACLALMEPTGCGLGGDLFALVWSARDQRLYALNGSGRAPSAMSIPLLREKGLDAVPRRGPLPVTVPGAVDGWASLHQRFGRRPWADLFAPTIRYARDGFPLTEVIAYYWGLSLQVLGDYPNVRDTYGMPDGAAPAKGTIFRNPALANTLATIAQGGRDAFYTGRIAETIARFLQEQGGVMTVADLAAHRSEWVEPVSTNYRGYDVWAIPPNGQGISVLQMLNLLEAYPFGEKIPFGSPEHIHLFTEAKKIAFEDRARFYADPAFNEIPVAALISKAYADERRRLLDPNRAARAVEPGNPTVLREGDTIYLTVADAEGNMVSLIQSNYRGMGSGMVPPGLGFMLQNRGEQFSLDPQHFNALQGGKRPFHTIIPGFVTKDGQPFLSFGVMGGEFQPLGQVQIVMNIIDYGMGLQEAGDAPRISHEGSTEPVGVRLAPMSDGGVLQLEHGFAVETLQALRALGHRVQASVPNTGGYQAIGWEAARKVYFGASESRKDGQAAGY